jgi:hypothetical protein
MKMSQNGVVTLDQLRLARNEISMRAGRPFFSEDLANFSIDQGYKPRLNYNELKDLTAIESRNAGTLSDMESVMKRQHMTQANRATIDKMLERIHRPAE